MEATSFRMSSGRPLRKARSQDGRLTCDAPPSSSLARALLAGFTCGHLTLFVRTGVPGARARERDSHERRRRREECARSHALHRRPLL